MKSLSLSLVLLLGTSAAFGQAPVLLAPVPIQQLFDQSGAPLAFGCVFSYHVASVTPLSTYTDYSGSTLNQNPVILSGSGTYSMWLQAGVAYTLVVKTAGGLNCSAGSTIKTIDGIGAGSTTLKSIVTFSSTPAFQVAAQNQLFAITLTGNASALPLTFVGVTPPSTIFFQITQDGSGAHTFSWPANTVGGCPIGSGAGQVTTEEFVYNGTNATAVGPCVIGSGPAVNFGVATGTALVSAAANPSATGVVRLANGDLICWRNNANSGDVCVSKSAADNLVSPNGLQLGGGAVLATTNQSGTGNLCMTTSCQLTTPALNGVTISGTPSAGQALVASSGSAAGWSSNSGKTILSHNITVLSGSNVTLPNSATSATILTQAVTMPSSGCPCRAILNYQLYILGNINGAAYDAWVNDGTSSWATSQTYMDATSRNGGLSRTATSENTYANNAVVTFTLKAQDGVGNTVVIGSASGGPQATWMTVDVVTSN